MDAFIGLVVASAVALVVEIALYRWWLAGVLNRASASALLGILIGGMTVLGLVAALIERQTTDVGWGALVSGPILLVPFLVWTVLGLKRAAQDPSRNVL